jgi:hypothetical protein
MRRANTGRFMMYASSILAGAVFLSFAIPSLLSAEEVTPTSNRIVDTTSTMWIGYAVSPTRRAFRSDPRQGEISARNAAKNECETTSLRTCTVIAVPENSSTDVSAVGCTHQGRSKSFVGGSRMDQQRRIALDKANNERFPDSSCVEFYTD